MNTLFVGQNIINLRSVNSTNNYTTELLRQSVIPEGTVVIAEEQVDGKGQRGNSWNSEAGKNLTFSLVLNPVFLSVSDQFYLHKLISLSILEFLEKKGCINVSVKWPNDVMVGKSKIGGILIENTVRKTHLQTTVIGIGLNINQKNFSISGRKISSLSIELNKEFDILFCLKELCHIIEYRYLKFKKTPSCFDKEYLEKMFQYNQFCSYEVHGELIESRISGVDKSGRLMLQRTNGIQSSYDFKEIIFL